MQVMFRISFKILDKGMEIVLLRDEGVNHVSITLDYHSRKWKINAFL